jgi:hypothetical protein
MAGVHGRHLRGGWTRLVVNRDQYLAHVSGLLPLPGPRRAEVLEELAAHLGDGEADLIAQGLAPDAAETEVLRRLGSPDQLARSLLRAHQTRSELLAAAGAGVVAAVRSGIYGALAGWFLVALASLLATVVLQNMRPTLGQPSGWTPGWNSVITGAGGVIGAALAGAAAVRAVAARSWRPVSEIRLAVAVAGAIVVAYLALVLAQETLNWASVVAYLAVPMAFVIGVRFDRLGHPHRRRLLAATTLLFAVALVLGTAGGFAGSSSGSFSMEWNDESHGYAMIAPWWQQPGSADADIVDSEMSWGTNRFSSITIDADSAAVAAQFSDARFEAWRAEPPRDGWALLPGQLGPYATAPVFVDRAAFSGAIALDQAPDVEWSQVVLTAAGPDGHRYLLWASGPQQSEFFGSVASWFAALAR